jgi:hypothetical protein
MTAELAPERTEREVQAYIRSRRKEHDNRRISDRLINVYMAALGTFYVGVIVSGFIDADITPRPGNFLDTIGWLPLVLLVAVWGVVRFATWQGPVLFGMADMQWLLSAPLGRRNLVALRLRRAFVLSGIVGAAAGVVAAVVADVMLGKGLVSVFFVAAAGFAALALLATALSWHVERSPRWSRAVARGTPVLLVAAMLLGVGAATGHDGAVWWSGPWGWATAPVVAVAGWSATGWVIQAILLGLAATGAIVSAVATAADVADEQLWRRAEAHSAAAAAMFMGDLRVVKTVARRERSGERQRGRSFHLVRVRRGWLAIAARDWLNLRRNPGPVGTAGVLVAIAFLAAVAAIDRPIFGVGTFVALYLAASRLLEPMRLEADRPGAHWILPWTWGTVLVMHCMVPAAILTALVWVAIGVVGVGGFVPATAVLPLILVAPFAAAALIASTAISAVRRPFPVDMLISGADSNSLVLVLWLISAPVLAAILTNIAFGAMRQSLSTGIDGGTLTAVVILSIGTLGITRWLATRKPPD